MAIPALSSAPVLSTPDTHIFEDPTPVVDRSNQPRLSDEQVAITYEIERTVREIRSGRWKRVALQFPDHMLGDAPRVYEQLSRGLGKARKAQTQAQSMSTDAPVEQLTARLETDMGLQEKHGDDDDDDDDEERLFILGDTSYGACCVDQVAAEHVDADCVVHYGRSCLSPPSRLPVIYVFTAQPLNLDHAVSSFQTTYPDLTTSVVLMADIPFAHHIPALHARLQACGYTSLFATEILHNPSSFLPNRTVPPLTDDADLLAWSLFHISSPPTALLLTLASRLASTHIFPTDPSPTPPTALLANTRLTLRRRYALCTRLASASIIGILINTLSVQHYQAAVTRTQQLIAAAGKKSYTFVVGKVNPAKVANFSEVDGWVVVGCWESGLVESEGFWRPLVTPFELGVALQEDGERVWTGEWRGGFEGVDADVKADADAEVAESGAATARSNTDADADASPSDEESSPPTFDLRTGRYISSSRPMQSPSTSLTSLATSTSTSTSKSLTTKTNTAITSINGTPSPAAEYLRTKRMWVGLGSDFHDDDDDNNNNNNGGGENGGDGKKRAAKMEEGRGGIARGYRVGGGGEVR